MLPNFGLSRTRARSELSLPWDLGLRNRTSAVLDRRFYSFWEITSTSSRNDTDPHHVHTQLHEFQSGHLEIAWFNKEDTVSVTARNHGLPGKFCRLIRLRRS